MKAIEEEDKDEQIDREEQAPELECRGDAVMTVGKALLGMDLILVCFCGCRVRTCSYLFWWVIAEGVLGSILLGIRAYLKSEAEGRLNALEPDKSAVADTPI